MPYAASHARGICESLSNCMKMAKDMEPTGEAYQERWEDDSELAPPLAPLWMADQLKVKRLPVLAYSVEATSSLASSPRRKARLRTKQKLSSTVSSVTQRTDGVMNIQSNLGRLSSKATSPSPLKSPSKKVLI